MTLAEVIDTLQTWIRNADDEYDREEMGRVAGLKEALHEIKKIEPCEDAISREAVEDAVIWNDEKREMLDEIQKLPSVRPKQKTGTWRKDIDNSRRWDRVRFYCSECGSWQTYGETDFCPSCGARMIKPQKSEE